MLCVCPQELNPFASVKICDANTKMDAKFLKNFNVVCMLDRPQAEQAWMGLNKVLGFDCTFVCFSLHKSQFHVS